jgi:hypothetical protein
LRSLQATYDFEPVAFTSTPPESQLCDAVLFCRVNSWLTGRRLVSVPYSDHCEPLAEDESVNEICAKLEREVRERRLRYFELRPLRQLAVRDVDYWPGGNYYSHVLDLTPGLDALYRRFHPSSVQRKIRRALKEGLECREGPADDLLDSFCRLLALTRRRHGIPAQPKIWFQNLIRFFGDALKIRVAMANGEAVASILTIRHKDTLVYKYGCSDARRHQLGGMQLLLWNAIQEAKRDDFKALDLGRSDADQAGLLQFKERWGSERRPLTYLRYTNAASAKADGAEPKEDWRIKAARQLVALVPNQMLTPVSRFLYKHGA